MDYDVAVIGNDEAAFEMLSLSAASKRRTVAILPESTHSAWLVGQSLRRLISDLLVDRTAQRRAMFAKAGTPRLLQALVRGAVVEEVSEHVRMLENIGVDVMLGEARFIGSRDLMVSLGVSCRRETVTARHLVIGTGVRQTTMHRPLGLMPFHRPESLLTGQHLPKTACVVGGGDVGAGLSALISLFGVATRHVARHDNESMMHELAAAAGVQIGYHPAEVGLPQFGAPFTKLHADVVDCRRSVGFTDHLSLDAINVEPDENGQLWCASNFETWCSGVFGIGDVVGFSPDTALHPSIQAERVMSSITRAIPRPHLLNSLVRATAAG
ncbi:MAG: FAD-dependent oxidoreductase [Fuerstiella sp.]|nr:FAD-dependent oxidoreductase [Fuerstiella sp.]